MFNAYEKVTFTLAGHAFAGKVYGYMRENDLIQIDLETGERIAVNPAIVSRIGQGYQIGQIIVDTRSKSEIVNITEKTVKVKVLEVYGRKPRKETFRTLKRETLLFATII
jgi:hypothetical protein